MAKKRCKIPAAIDAELTPKARAFVLDLIEEHEREVAQLKREIASLKKKLEKLTPNNSSIPPSTQHPHAKDKPKRKKPKRKTGKKQGGQPGHPRTTRPLVPTKDCDEVITLRPQQCRKCDARLNGKDPTPLRHQVFELPEIKPLVTEYQQHRLTCRCCGTQTCAPLPKDVPTGQCGPRLAAFTGLLMVHFRQSKRRAASFLSDLLNVPCSPAWMVKIQNRVSDALAQPYEELRSELQDQNQLFLDESPTKQNKTKAWLWVAVAPLFAVFGIFLSRKRAALRALVGNYSGIIINCDRAKMYFNGERLQWCWAHLKRDIQRLIDSQDRQVKRLGHDLMREQRLIFEQWHLYQNGKISWKAFQRRVAPLREVFDSLLLRGCFSGNKRLIGMCDELYQHRSWLWTFTEVEGIEPTNNTAERALRPAVIYRKLSFGTQSASGSRFVERMLTVSETCRLQSRSPFQYLVEAMKAYFSKQSPPSLLPTEQMDSAKKCA